MTNNSTLRQLEQILAKRQKYVIKSDKSRRDYDAVNATLIETNTTLATLIQDLKKQGVLK